MAYRLDVDVMEVGSLLRKAASNEPDVRKILYAGISPNSPRQTTSTWDTPSGELAKGVPLRHQRYLALSLQHAMDADSVR